MKNVEKIKSVLLGVAIGDALGVPVEFQNRRILRRDPVTDMRGFGTHHMPAGTFSDDSSLTFCLAEALTHDFDLKTIGQNFVKWYKKNYWTANAKIFDIGFTTRAAIERLAKGVRPELAGDFDVSTNGNGSLMRISPLLFYLQNKPVHKRYEVTKQVSSLTHGHIRSVVSCFYYLEFGLKILEGKRDKFEVYESLKSEISDYINLIPITSADIALFDRLLKHNIYDFNEDEILSSGYVLHTLEASIWCILTTDNFKDTVLKAVNLGEDTDTTAAVTGGLAGLVYGHKSIPENWLNQLARRDEIEDLAERMFKKL